MYIPQTLLNKYNVPVPRYTSYPTVPFWNNKMDDAAWVNNFQEQYGLSNQTEGISLYLHLPFCESLCTYCGCNKKITSNHSVEDEYITTILKEWQLYRNLMTETPVIRELHLGGGTPTFFSPDNLKKMLEGIFKDASIHPEHEFSFEGHPNNTTKAHLETLYQLGFSRVSYGVQDHDLEIQRIINRIQPVENVKRATDMAREIGYQSVNFDLIYGLPLQNLKSIERTIKQSITMKPDRVAFYSYAHVPWTSKGQRLFNENDLPSPDKKMLLYQRGQQLFLENGFVNIGMDHFAVRKDSLVRAKEQGKLHRNFMGYTTHNTSLLLGLGVSAISDTGTGYAQNEKSLKNYIRSINENKRCLQRGYFLNEEDIAFRNYILDISCRGETLFREKDLEMLNQFSFPTLRMMQEDDLLHFIEKGIQLTPIGHHFIRNACSAFDLHMLQSKTEGINARYSNAV